MIDPPIHKEALLPNPLFDQRIGRARKVILDTLPSFHSFFFLRGVYNQEMLNFIHKYRKK